MNEMSRVRARAILAEFEKQASQTESLFVKVAYGLYGRDLDVGKVVDLVIAQPPSNVQEIRDLAGQYLQGALMRAIQDEEMKSSPPATAAQQVELMAEVLRSRLNFMREQKEYTKQMAEEQMARMQAGAAGPGQMQPGANPATAAAAQFPGTLTPSIAGQAPQGAPQGPALPSSPMEAAGGTE